MNRRGFLGSILAAAVAPAIVRADSLMRIVPRETLFMNVDMAFNDATAVARMLGLQLIGFSVIEEQCDIIETTTIMSAHRTWEQGLTYRIGEIDLALPPSVNVQALYADGISIDMRKVLIHRNPGGIDTLSVLDFDLTDYGYRIPSFEMEIKP